MGLLVLFIGNQYQTNSSNGAHCRVLADHSKDGVADKLACSVPASLEGASTVADPGKDLQVQFLWNACHFFPAMRSDCYKQSYYFIKWGAPELSTSVLVLSAVDFRRGRIFNFRIENLKHT